MRLFRKLLPRITALCAAFGAAILLVYLLTPLPRPAARPYTPRPFNLAEDLSADVSLVTLDRESGRIYVRLNLLSYRHPSAPESLWVRTYFFTPENSARRVWASTPVELERPFAAGRGAGVTVAAPCHWCADKDAPLSGYFARVQLYADGGQTPLPSGEEFFDITTAAPVVVQFERPSDH